MKLGALESPKQNVEAIYPLSPMQQAFLIHHISAGKTDLGFLQGSCVLEGDLNLAAFERACEQAVDRHPVLRTSFFWEDLDNPLQVVHRRVTLSWARQDWRGLSELEQEKRLESFLDTDRERGFDLSKAPLLRLALMRAAEDKYFFTWSSHHMVIDGWSTSLLFNEILALYEALRQGRELHLERPTPYREYIVWLNQQDMSKAEAFWRRSLKGFSASTPLGVKQSHDRVFTQVEAYNKQTLNLSVVTAALQSLARQHGLTMNTMIQGAWALLLARYSGNEDVVFGATVSGRPPDLPGIESTVGFFINTLPVRVQVSPAVSLLSWMKKLQAQQLEMRQYEYTPLVEIQEWSEVHGGLRLFDSLLIFENYWSGSFLGEQTGSLRFRNFRGDAVTTYPLTIMAKLAPELSLTIIYDSCRFDATTVNHMLSHFQTLLGAMADNSDRTIEDLPLPNALPLKPSGAGNHGVAPASDQIRTDPEGSFVAPRTPLEFLIAEVWRDVLDVDRVSVHDNFFDLGGHSLLASKVMSRLEKKLGLRINLGELAFQTLGQLATACEERVQLRQQSKPRGLGRKSFSAIIKDTISKRIDRK